LEWSTIRAILLPDNCIFTEATIYIADNASTDESIAFVQHYPAIKIIKIMLILVLLKDIMKH
jgi:GT2 family glycosyltransferase